MDVTLSEDNFKKIFPFHVRINNQLEIVDAGPSMEKIIGEINNRSFLDVFKFVRPSLSIQLSFESFKSHLDAVVILESIEFPVLTRFRGQFVYLENENELVYINSPWITSLGDLEFHNLLITDFAIHDTVVDNILSIQSKQIVNEDMAQIAQELRSQRDELIEKNNTILALAEFPEQNPSPILRMNYDGKVIYSNNSAQILINEHELLELGFWKQLTAEIGTISEEYIKKEIVLSNHVYMVTILPIYQKEYINMYFDDITDTVKYQNELIDTSTRLYSLIENMNSAILAEDEDRKIILVNQMFCDLFLIPLKPDEMTGIDCHDAAENSKGLFIDEQGFVNRIDHILNQRAPVFGDLLYLKNGIILERDYVPVFENNIYKGHIWRYQDITEIVKNKESLIKVEEKYRKIIENLKLGLIEVDLDENITKVYPAFSEMTGYSQEELLAGNARELLTFDDQVDVMETQNDLRKEGVSGVYETKIKTKDGSPKWLIISGAPIYNETNDVVGSLGIHVDITERKILEQELMKAKDDAFSSVKAKEMFIANMSHEIRTPMNVIIGMTELLSDSFLTKEQSKYLGAIKTSADNLLKLINDILDFSKIEAGFIELEEMKLNIEDICDNLEVSFLPKATEKGILINKKINKSIATNLYGDSFKLNQVLVNLVNNAIKFTDQGSVTVCCELVQDFPDVQKVNFSIIDTGIGISNENLDAIFQMFKQEDSSITRRFGGTGLGLSISKSIVESMGGTISVKSEKNVGSIFSFDLTFKKDKKNNAQREVVAKINEHFENDISILIAEDNELNQLLVTSILERENIKYDVAGDGNEVLRKLEGKKYNLILMDIQMPEMDGLATTAYIREKLKMTIPIIALTANASTEDEKRYKDAGMNDYIAKPFKRDELIFKIYLQLNLDAMNTNMNEANFMNENPDSLYSLKNIEAISQGDQQFVKTIIETFKTNTPNYLNEVSIGIQTADFAKIKYASHQMKPSLDILEIESVRQVVRDIENESSSSNPDLDKIKSDFSTLDKIVRTVIDHMQQIV